MELIAATNLKVESIEKQVGIANKETKILFGLDSTSEFFKYVQLDGRRLSIKGATTAGWFPVFLSRIPIHKRQYYEIELTAFNNKLLAVGITTMENRNKLNMYYNQGSSVLWLYGNYGASVGGLKTETNYNGSAGDVLRVTVDLVDYTVEWEMTRPNSMKIASVSIPENLRQNELYPYLDFHYQFDGIVTVL